MGADLRAGGWQRVAAVWALGLESDPAVAAYGGVRLDGRLALGAGAQEFQLLFLPGLGFLSGRLLSFLVVHILCPSVCHLMILAGNGLEVLYPMAGVLRTQYR